MNVTILGNYKIFQKYTTKQLNTTYNLFSNQNMPIYLSSDKYGYNSNLVGMDITINYDDAQYQSIMNNQSIVLNVNQYYVNSNYTSYTTSTNLLTNITSQTIVDNYGNETQLYQESYDSDLSNYNSNRFQITPINNTSFEFKTNFKFSNNSKQGPWYIYLFQPVVIYINTSNYTGFKQTNKLIKKLYILWKNPLLTSDINISINYQNILLQKNYPIVSYNYAQPQKKIKYTPNEIINNNYINNMNNTLVVPFKLIIDKNIQIKNKPLSIPINVKLTPLTYNNNVSNYIFDRIKTFKSAYLIV